jgi:hypothetical protein
MGNRKQSPASIRLRVHAQVHVWRLVSKPPNGRRGSGEREPRARRAPKRILSTETDFAERKEGEIANRAAAKRLRYGRFYRLYVEEIVNVQFSYISIDLERENAISLYCLSIQLDTTPACYRE